MDKLQGSHSDVFALGMLMADLCKLADRHITHAQRSVYANTGLFRSRLVSDYYSQPLKELIRRCRSKLGKDRPDAHALYEATKEKMEQYRAKAYAAEEKSRSDKYPGHIFHEKVLFTKNDQDLFRENSDFRGYFLEANLVPVRKAEHKHYMKPWKPADLENDDNDTSIVTDHHTTTHKRRIAPEARVKTGLAEDLITSRAWRLFIEQSLDPLVDRFSVSIPSESTTKFDVSDIQSSASKEKSTQSPVAAPPAPAAENPPNEP